VHWMAGSLLSPARAEVALENRWDEPLSAALAARATHDLESGNILFLPQLGFTLAPAEARFLAPGWTEGRAKNISYDPGATRIHHTSAQGEDRRQSLD